MNTNPDEATLALWLDDELAGDEHAAMESWARTQPDQMAARDEIRHWRSLVTQNVPAVEEPPYPEFFNSRVLQSIRESSAKPSPAEKRRVSWTSWLMPLAACGGMVLAFWVGKTSSTVPDYDVAGAPKAIPVEPVLYTPEKGVDAEWIASTEASATVIVLNGVAAIPDATDFSATVYLPTEREIDSTAGGAADPATETAR